MPAAPLITPAPVPRDLPAATKLVVRQQVTTISVVASSAPSGVNTGPDTSEKKGFPIAVAIPALVGGMAAAIAAFGLWWWCHKKSKKERRVSLPPYCYRSELGRDADCYRNDGKQLRERNSERGQTRPVDLQCRHRAVHPLPT